MIGEMANGLDLGKQVGPLPLGAWIVVVGGGLGIALWTRNKGTADPVVTEDTSGDAGVGTGPGWVAVPPPSGNPVGSDTPTYETNEAWGTAAINWLIAQGYNAGLAVSAITKALAGGQDTSGNKMSIQEWTLWTLALTKMGSPPYPVNVSPPTTGVPGPGGGGNPPPGTNPPPGPPPSTKVPPHTSYVVKHGDTLSGIAKKYGTTWQTIWNFNLKYRSPATVAILKLRGPNHIFAGSTFWIPKK